MLTEFSCACVVNATPFSRTFPKQFNFNGLRVRICFPIICCACTIWTSRKSAGSVTHSAVDGRWSAETVMEKPDAPAWA
jgi:hypothetical protein